MADPFSPKFVDLVRNFTTTTGTGNIVLGTAVSGHASLAGAVAVGERFYYCILGVDKPAQREVGRGTMTANGTIAREAIGGVLTNFTSGSKTIALVAAAEWFRTLGQMVNGGGDSLTALATTDKTSLMAAVNEVSAAAAAAAALANAASSGAQDVLFTVAGGSAVPAIRRTVATAGYSLVGVGGAIYILDAAVNAAYVTANPFTAFLAADGRGFRLDLQQRLTPQMFGAVGNGVTNDGAAFVAALAFLKTQAVVGYGYSKGSAELFVPASIYFLGTTTLDISHSITLRGESVGSSAGGASVLKWTAGTTGIRTQAVNTVGATGYNGAWTLYSAGLATIRNLTLHGGHTSGSAESEAHGIHLRVTAQIYDCAIYNFPGDGIYSLAAAGAGAGGSEGNSNVSAIRNVLVQGCRNALFLDGADTNAYMVMSLNANSNRRWGIYDSSFLGNTYIGCHSAANGWDGAGGSIPTATTHLGNRYHVKAGQEAGASTNAPSGTTASNIWWGYIAPGGVYAGVPVWVSGTVFRTGGGYFTDNPNARNVIIGCYTEGDENPNQIVPPTLVIGGLNNSIAFGYAGALGMIGGEIYNPGAWRKASGPLTISFGESGTLTESTVYRANHTTYAPLDFRVSFGLTSTGSFLPQDIWTTYNNGSIEIERLTGPTTLEQFGTGVAQPYIRHVAKFALGTYNQARKMDYAAVVPAAGVHGRGEIIFNNSPSAGGIAAWVCTTTGTPGTYSKDYLNERSSPTVGIGYVALAGGAVTQITSKATAVTLNNVCGAITMDAGSLAADTAASFTLTNSAIAATDIVTVCIKSGATGGAYAVVVDAVAAGSCRISVRNLTAGALAEAIVLSFAVIKAVAA